MNNSGFVNINEETKAKNLTEVLNKRCRGFIKPDVLNAVVNRLDFHRQMNIDVVNEEIMVRQARVCTEIMVDNGDITKIFVRWCRCLLGHIEFGKNNVVYEDGAERITCSTQSKIVTTPCIVQVDEQNLGDLDYTSSRLLICL